METLKKRQLFWDVDFEKFDPKKNREFIVLRILQQGDLNDFQWARDFYSQSILADIFKKSIKKINKKSCNFWSKYFRLDEKECIAKQSAQKQSAFWTK